MRIIGQTYPPAIGARYDLLDGRVMISTDEAYHVFNLEKHDTGYADPWKDAKAGDHINVRYAPWGYNRVMRQERLVINQEFIDRYHAPVIEEPDVKITVIKEGLDDEEFMMRRGEHACTEQMEWVDDEIRIIMYRRFSYKDIRDLIMNPPKVWKVETPKGEGTFVSMHKPYVLAYDGCYYVFVISHTDTAIVYRTLGEREDLLGLASMVDDP